MEKRKQTVVKLAQTALLAALCFVSFTFLQRTGDCKTDSFSEKRHTACDRNTGTCDGSYAPQNYENGSCAYDRAG